MTKRFASGQRVKRFPGSLLNDMQDRIDRLERLLTGHDLRRPPTADRPWLPVFIKNNTGIDLIERSIVGVDVSALTPPDIVPAEGSDPEENTADAGVLKGIPVEVVKPNADTHKNKVVVTLGPIKQDACGWGVMIGLMWARVDVTDNAHKFAAIETDDTQYLKSAASGMPIVDRKLSGTGKQWAIVLLGGGGGRDGASGTFICHLDADINPAVLGSTEPGSAEVFSVGEGGALTSLGTRNVYSPFTCKLPASAAQYACAKTFEGETDADDEFTITGPDMMQVLYSLTGSAEKTTLSLPSGETSAADIQWLGGDC